MRVYSKSGGNGGFVYPSNPPKSPGTAALLSCLIVGVGQMYLGQIKKGLAWLLGIIVLSFITAGVLWLPILIASIVDAYKTGQKLANGQPVGEWEFF
jgi:TM2 domain-containing membrane protein YozV